MTDAATNLRELGEAVRKACIAAALSGYEDAAIRGLCHEGAWEAAVSAMRGLDLGALVAAAVPSAAPPTACGAAARTGALAAALLASAAARAARRGPEPFRPRARSIASRAATLASSLGADARADAADAGDAALELGARCAQVATRAAELASDGGDAARSDAAVALRLAASAAECALALGEESLGAATGGERTRSARRRIWRTRLLLRRARPAAAEDGAA